MGTPRRQNESLRFSDSQRLFALLTLIVAGESIFFLPFLLPRVFRPTLLEVFGITNSELGTAMSAYGVVAMVAYVLGGPLADYFRPRRLIAVALVTTALGGIVLWQVPARGTLNLLYGYWGFTTIALFWAALIRATRQWGGQFSQGLAFGLLDGGRGLLAAITGSCTVALYAALMPEDVESAPLEVRASALKQVIIVFSSVTFSAAVMVWLLLTRKTDSQQNDTPGWSLSGIWQVALMPVVWLQALIIVCAYVGFKATDDFSLYAHEVLGLNEVDAARLGTYSLWIRPVGAIGAGFLADRFGGSNMMVASFALLAVGSSALAAGIFSSTMYVPFLMTIVCASLGIFALRGLYFAIMQEGRVPLTYTGSAVGLVSVIGYTPDVFMGPLMGHLLDGNPGELGHRHLFMVVTGFAVAGLLASFMYRRLAQVENALKDPRPNAGR